jgi:hypothetical protein
MECFRNSKQCSGRTNGYPEGAAKLAANQAGEGPASRTCPVATVVIPDGGGSDPSLPIWRGRRDGSFRIALVVTNAGIFHLRSGAGQWLDPESVKGTHQNNLRSITLSSQH